MNRLTALPAALLAAMLGTPAHAVPPAYGVQGNCQFTSVILPDNTMAVEANVVGVATAPAPEVAQQTDVWCRVSNGTESFILQNSLPGPAAAIAAVRTGWHPRPVTVCYVVTGHYGFGTLSSGMVCA